MYVSINFAKLCAFAISNKNQGHEGWEGEKVWTSWEMSADVVPKPLQGQEAFHFAWSLISNLSGFAKVKKRLSTFEPGLPPKLKLQQSNKVKAQYFYWVEKLPSFNYIDCSIKKFNILEVIDGWRIFYQWKKSEWNI